MSFCGLVDSARAGYGETSAQRLADALDVAGSRCGGHRLSATGASSCTRPDRPRHSERQGNRTVRARVAAYSFVAYSIERPECANHGSRIFDTSRSIPIGFGHPNRTNGEEATCESAPPGAPRKAMRLIPAGQRFGIQGFQIAGAGGVITDPCLPRGRRPHLTAS